MWWRGVGEEQKGSGRALLLWEYLVSRGVDNFETFAIMRLLFITSARDCRKHYAAITPLLEDDTYHEDRLIYISG